MWFDHDDFHYAWKKVKGDFLVQASAEFLGAPSDPHRKMGLIVRASLDPKSPHVNACRHGNGVTAPCSSRKGYGADTGEVHVKPSTGSDVLQLERVGDRFTMSAAKFGDTYTTQDAEAAYMPGEVYVGLYICAHNNSVVEKGTFTNVRLIRPAKPDFKPYRDYIGSDIELMDAATGVRRAIYHGSDSLQAPNWTPDGRKLVYNHNGRMFTLDLSSLASAPIDTGAQVHCNNDHTLSFDGKMLGISSGSTSMVYTLPIGGGTPRQITPTGPSYLHGWSPDGKFLLFTGQRDGNFDIYRVPSAGGPEVRLTTARGLNDGSEYSPDGKTIFFNLGSQRTDADLEDERRRFRAGPGDERRVQQLVPPCLAGRENDPFHQLSLRHRGERPSLLQARLPAPDAGGRREAHGRRLPLRRPGLNQRELVVARQPDGGLRQQLGLDLRRPARRKKKPPGLGRAALERRIAG